ncbi:MAG TPA: YhcN/YlaJ family sporulation lipoprotein [Bacillus sp. (in: firmicutes)]|uniref:YhcN/YlaJ family sporulation lipoprotein n=1 Tax=Bacillus litorisediminis TaxID=2922713 RepID=UPI001FAC68C0|nr:YhcN/YlaJ family sporulation lipoprotein [Bacillus litorisediminis]HWO77167.1 YhcN/YlaJ family sporulation lipoprotein [Bacillus sp. (in: firmicutes)]
MKKTFITIGICGFILTGCNDNEAGQDIYKESGNTINVTDSADLYNPNLTDNDSQKNEEFGYVRHQRNPIPGDNTVQYGDILSINREALADTISRIAVQIPNVEDAATLVTDEEVLIAYRSNSEDRNATADQVKKTALSFVPRYYHVYVADDPLMIREIENISPLDSDSDNVESIVDQTIQKMLKYPQGNRLGNGENENGEYEGDVNDNMDRDDIHQMMDKNKNNNRNNNR